MRNLDATSFFATDPRGLRVALQTDDRVKPGNPAIDIRIEGMSKTPICYAFGLTPVDAAAPGEAPLEKSPGRRRWFAYGLSKQGVEAFDRARREVHIGKMDGGSFALNVTMKDIDFPHDMKSLPFRIDVLLDRNDGFFTLIKETEVSVAKDDKQTAAKPPSSTEKPVAAQPPSSTEKPVGKPDCIPAA